MTNLNDQLDALQRDIERSKDELVSSIESRINADLKEVETMTVSADLLELADWLDLKASGTPFPVSAKLKHWADQVRRIVISPCAS